MKNGGSKMGKWKHKKKMFPNKSNINNELTYDDLDNSDYSFVSSKMLKIARNMIIQEQEIIWNRNGTVERKNNYNVFPEDIPDNISALSCYGNRMVLDWKQVNNFNYTENENVRYNYTGIQ